MTTNATTILEYVKKAYDTHETSDMKAALRAVRLIKTPAGDLDLNLMTELKMEGIRFVWGTVENSDTHKEKRLALVYKGVAFEIE